ncbi:MAG TPA: CPBP family intramembrane glutamic endopeptidase, partial [Bacteroidota bacterium]|nr:CPBP family intramembrane glutamic endopeptidase [Bacteroidota bacterium]
MEEQPALLNSSSPQATITPIRIPLIERYGISSVLFGFLILIVVFILYQFIGGIITYIFFGLRPTSDTIDGFRIVTGLGQVMFLLIPTLLLVRFATLTPAQYLRLTAPDPRTLIPPLVGIFSLQQMLQIYLYFQEKIPLPETVRNMVDKFKEMIEEVYRLLVSSHSIPELIMVIFVIAFIPAIAEELLFRGLVQRSFEKGLTATKGMILTGIIFGVYHLNP